MNTLYPDATPEELAAADNVCIICREEMVTGKQKCYISLYDSMQFIILMQCFPNIFDCRSLFVLKILVKCRHTDIHVTTQIVEL
jgi:hypothetical protein